MINPSTRHVLPKKTKTNSTITQFEGVIYQYDSAHKTAEKYDYEHLGQIKDMDQKENDITGDWMKHMNIDDSEVWNVNKQQIEPHLPVPNPIPSDPRYREDLIWIRNENKDYAQEWKTVIENQ